MLISSHKSQPTVCFLSHPATIFVLAVWLALSPNPHSHANENSVESLTLLLIWCYPWVPRGGIGDRKGIMQINWCWSHCCRCNSIFAWI